MKELLAVFFQGRFATRSGGPTARVKISLSSVLERKMQDGFEKCGFDGVADFVEESVTDLDHDGIGELSFGYRFGCRSDVSPVQAKVMLFEGKEKYAIRGTTKIVDRSGATMGGEQQEIDPASL